MLVIAFRYLAFVLLCLVGPGLAAQRLLRLRIEPALVFPVGSVVAAAAYWLSLRLALPWLFPLLVLGLDLALLLRLRPWALAAGSPSLRGALPPLLALAAFFALTQYSANRRHEGEFLLDHMGDQPLHVGVTRELTLPYPPQVPGLSGVPLRYHFGADLVRAAALRWALIDPYDSMNRLELTLGTLGLVLALRSVAQRAGASPLAVTLVPWTLLATDFSFLFAGVPRARWWADIFRGNLLYSVAFANPVVPGLCLALGCIVALSRLQEGEGKGFWLLAALQALALPYFKVFTGAHLVLALAVAAWRCSPPVRIATLATALLPLLGSLSLALDRAGGNVDVELAPLAMVRSSLEGNLRFAPLAGLSLALWALVWLFASLGLRALGLPRAVTALRSRSVATVALAALALSGWPLGLLFNISAHSFTGERLPTAAIYFLEQAGCALWVFTAMALAAMLARTRRPALLICGCALLTLPSSVEFVVRKRRQPLDSLPAPMVRAMDVLERQSPPGAVVLQKPTDRFPPAPALLISRRVPFERFSPYLTQFAPPELLGRRHETVVRFFQTRDAEEARRIARELQADYLCLYDSDRVRFDGRKLLELLYEEEGARVYRIRLEPDALPEATGSSVRRE